MNAMLVGADTLGNIPGVLDNFGISINKHLSGRNSSHQRKVDRLPAGTDLLILFTDFLGHNVMKHFRQLANADSQRIALYHRHAGLGDSKQVSQSGLAHAGRLAQ